MTTRVLAMPDYMADLVSLALNRLGLAEVETDDDMVTCPLVYEDGHQLAFTVLHVAKRGLLGGEKRLSMLSLYEVDDNGRPTLVHLRDLKPAPTGPHDLPFMVQISASIRSMAWAVAAAAGHGECVDLPRGPKAAS